MTSCNTVALKKRVIKSFMTLVSALPESAYKQNVHCQSRKLLNKVSSCSVVSTQDLL